VARGKLGKTLGDLVAVAICPALIMALVGSLVFFLVEVLYVGQYQGSLLFILFCYVFGTVLTARIAATHAIAERAGLYGAILSLLTWFGLQRYVEYPANSEAAEYAWAAHIGWLALIWWCAHRLVWDCTVIDERQDASGAGLLQKAGLEENPEEEVAAAAPPPEAEPPRPEKGPALVAWWRRFRRYREERRRRPHTPGVWVVYFSLAALPLFGVGQSLIPPSAVGRQQRAFWLLCVYVASGLGLLLTTCYLGLRRYLRQRKLEMPRAMTGAWLLMGVTLIVVFLVVGALLPRPAAEYALVEVPWLARSRDHDASRWAVQNFDAGKNEGRAGPEAGKDEEAKAAGSRGEPKEQGGSGEKGKGGSKASAKGSGPSKQKGDGGGPKADSQKGNPSSEKAEAKGAPKGAAKTERPEPSGKGERPPEKGKQERQGEKSPPGKGSSGKAPAPTPPRPDVVPSWTTQLAVALKWLVLGVFALVIGFLVLRALLRFLANFTSWARWLLEFFRNFWQGLWPVRRDRDGAEVVREQGPAPVPFTSFADPFLSGRARRMSAEELVRYSFDALQAWAREHDLPRQTGETPLEYAERLSMEVPPLGAEVRRLAGYYVGLAYAGSDLPEDGREALQQFWQALREVAEGAQAVGAAGG
jgi:hypothetical protein